MNYQDLDFEPNMFQQEHHITEMIQQEHHITEYHRCELVFAR
jgi:hypothetical protein